MDWFELAERDHEIQNPTSVEKIRLVGECLRLCPESRVLDLACGKGGPARILARSYGCRVLGVELRAAWADEARRRAAEEGLAGLVDVRTGDAAACPLEPAAWDAALCLGAAFVWGTIEETAAELARAVRPGGGIAVGEPYWRTWPLPHGRDAESYVSLAETVERFERSGVALTGIVAASEDDWDRYESLHWRAIEEWLAANPKHQDAGAVAARQARHRGEYLSCRRELLGWAIFVGRRPPAPLPADDSA